MTKINLKSPSGVYSIGAYADSKADELIRLRIPEKFKCFIVISGLGAFTRSASCEVPTSRPGTDEAEAF